MPYVIAIEYPPFVTGDLGWYELFLLWNHKVLCLCVEDDQ